MAKLLTPRVFEVPAGFNAPNLKTRDLTFQNASLSIDPFLIVSVFDMTGPVFPPHPHAGFSVATYIFPESEVGFWNQDTLGTHNHIAPGSLHWTIAGAGLQHEETPTRSGKHATGLQIWINHSAHDRLLAPQGLHLAESGVPVVTANNSVVRVLVGHHNHTNSPLVVPSTARLLDIEIKKTGAVSEQLEDGEQCFVVVRAGQIEINGSTTNAGNVAFIDAGALDMRSMSDTTSRATLFAGVPLKEPVVAGGPFIGSDQTEIAAFQARFRQGELGRLTPFDQNDIDRKFDMDHQK